MLGIELFGNVGLLVHGARTDKRTNEIPNQKNRERGRRRPEGQIGLFTLFHSLLSPFLCLSRRLLRCCTATRKENREKRKRDRRQKLVLTFIYYYIRVLPVINFSGFRMRTCGARVFNLWHAWRRGSEAVGIYVYLQK